MHICLTSNFRLYFAFFAPNCQKKAHKFLLHNKAKNFVSLQVLKAIILSLKNSKMLTSGQQAILKTLIFTKKQLTVDFTRMGFPRDAHFT